MPDYSQSLSDAWARICDNTGYLDPSGSSTIISTVSALRDRLTPVGQLAQGDLPSLGSAAAPRFARLGARVPVKPGADAWAVVAAVRRDVRAHLLHPEVFRPYVSASS